MFAACPCDSDPRYTGNCDVGTGKCECKEAFRGADDCSACADGYYDYPDCKPCDCFANGTVYVPCTPYQHGLRLREHSLSSCNL